MLRNDMFNTCIEDPDHPASTAEEMTQLFKSNAMMFTTLGKIEVHTEEMCYWAVKSDPSLLKEVQIQTEEICLEAIKQDTDMLEFVKEQTPTICMAAINKYPGAIREVREQTPELCILALLLGGEDEDLLTDIRIPLTPEICRAAVFADASNIIEIPEDLLTEELCIMALRKDPDVFEWMALQTDAICMVAVEGYPGNLRHVKNQTHDICLTALKQDDSVWHDIKDKTEELSIAAVLIHEDMLRSIPEEFKEACKKVMIENDIEIIEEPEEPAINDVWVNRDKLDKWWASLCRKDGNNFVMTDEILEAVLFLKNASEKVIAAVKAGETPTPRKIFDYIEFSDRTSRYTTEELRSMVTSDDLFKYHPRLLDSNHERAANLVEESTRPRIEDASKYTVEYIANASKEEQEDILNYIRAMYFYPPHSVERYPINNEIDLDTWLPIESLVINQSRR